MQKRYVVTALGAVTLTVALVIGGHAAVSATPVGVADAVVVPPSSASALAGTANRRPAGMPRKPNVVVVMADDMRYDDLRFAPNIRRLVADRGLRFRNAYANYPLCCPARASFLTGRLAHNHRVWWHERPFGYGSFDDSRTLATAMRRAGYRTGFVGKYLNGYGVMDSRVSGRPSYRYVPRGWDEWHGAIENPGRDGIHGGTYYYWDTPYNRNGRIDNSYRGRYQTDVIGDLSIETMRRVSRPARRTGGQKPFFLYLNYVAPHHGAPGEPDDPGRATDRDGRVYELLTPARPDWVKGRFDRQIRSAPGRPRTGPAERSTQDKGGVMRGLPEPTAREWDGVREVARQRAESIAVMDRQVGRLVRALKQRGEWRDTVLAFTSDNGYFLGEHRLRQGKVYPHDPSLRVPLVMTGPGMRQGEDRWDPVSTVDLTATVLDLGRARMPWAVDGSSRVPTLVRDRGWRQPVPTEATHTGGEGRRKRGFGDPRTSMGIRTAHWSYVRNRGSRDELYELRSDPHQLRSLATRPAYRDELAMMRRLMLRWADCRGVACRATLPPALRADPAANRAQGRLFVRETQRRYGRR